MLSNLGLTLLECFKLHYSSTPKPGTQSNVPFLETKGQQLSSLDKAGHTHTFFQYTYVIAGFGAQILIGAKLHDAVAGQIYLIAPDTEHKIVFSSQYELIVYEIKFSVSDPTLSAQLQALPCVIEDSNSQLLHSIRSLISEYTQQSFLDLMPYIKLYELLVLLRRSAKNAAASDVHALRPYEMEHSRFVPVLAYINHNLASDISVSDMADVMHMEKGYFSRQFRKVFGTTPMHYLLAVRISRAMNMLEYTELSVNEISEAIGFHNQNSFIKAFKSLYEMTPGEYRKKIRPIIRQKYTNQQPL